MKRIVICCDGTWNEPESSKDDHVVPTNVLKMVRAIQPRDAGRGIDQIVFYDQGVGTGALGFLDRAIGGGMGYGISQNIRECYLFLANNYVPGDEIYLFGFSRGAYTVRSLSGLLSAVGLLDKEHLRYAPQAYEYYRHAPEKRAAHAFHKKLETLTRVKPAIKCVGVWDTVGALGIPTPILGWVQSRAGAIWKRFSVKFHNTALSPSVEHAYQALAIDERRGPFRPALWDARNGSNKVQQVWFAGVHSNIGGGYSDQGLSDLAFTWLVNRAQECGLVMNDGYLSRCTEPNALGHLENSYSLGYKVLEVLRVKPYTRKLGQHLQQGEMIHESVVARVRCSLDNAYLPRNLVAADGALHTTQDAGREWVVINGVSVPVFKERAALRIDAGNSLGSISVAGRTAEPCRVLDFSVARGARLRVAGQAAVGAPVTLDSPTTGPCDALVVWTHNGEMGLRIVA